MFCRSFPRVEEEDDSWSPSVARRTRRKCRRTNKNPYSKRGLDKFSMVLADLETRREKIVEQMGLEDVSIIRFVYSNSNEWVPIVVKKPEKKMKMVDEDGIKEVNSEPAEKSIIGVSAARELVLLETQNGGRINKNFCWGAKEISPDLLRWKPYYYLCVAVILILLCLVLFGRSFGILCTSIWWYLVPTTEVKNLKTRRSIKIKDYMRRASEKNMVSSQWKKMGVSEGSSPRQLVKGGK